MKYPLDKSEWKWVILGVIMIAVMCLIFGTVMYAYTGEETFLKGSAILGVLFIWIKIVRPIVDRI